jgi:hypothetical protein
MFNEVEIISLNLPSPLVCEHIKKKKKKAIDPWLMEKKMQQNK